jgi:crotonobetainyl-CoA:carnitine CoA-transferase CaiB-like acyl-CoA transferase
MTTDNIFSGIKVVDLASFIAGPGAAVILSDFGADVIKVEPPTGDLWRIGYKVPPQPRAKDNYPWHLNNRNKRGLALDLKSPDAGKILERLVNWADVLIVNTPHPARKKLKLTEVINDPQLRENDIVVPLEGAGDNLKLTISSPMQVHDVTKVPAKRAPEIGEHNDEVLKELGFSGEEIGDLRTSGAIPHLLPPEEATAGRGR